MESAGPLPLLEDLRDSDPRVRVHWRDWHNLEKVRVEVAEDALRTRRMDFYPTKSTCEDAAELNRRMADSSR
jgi:hypothetical protein